jgi:hypothetical protein
MLAPKGLGLVTANLGWLHASCLPIARHPSDGGADSDPKPGRSLVARHPLGWGHLRIIPEKLYGSIEELQADLDQWPICGRTLTNRINEIVEIPGFQSS